MRYLLAFLVLAFSTVAVADPIEKAVKARQGYYTMLAANLGPLSAMAKGELDYNEPAAVLHGSNIEALAGYDLTMHFPEGSSADQLGKATEAKAKIWADLDDFGKKFADFQQAAAGAGESVKGGRGNVGAVVKGLGKTCKSCHDDYRVKK